MSKAEERLCSRCKKKKFIASGLELCSSCIVAEAEGVPLLRGHQTIITNPIGMVIVEARRKGGAGIACSPGKRPVKLRESEE